MGTKLKLLCQLTIIWYENPRKKYVCELGWGMVEFLILIDHMYLDKMLNEISLRSIFIRYNNNKEMGDCIGETILPR